MTISPISLRRSGALFGCTVAALLMVAPGIARANYREKAAAQTDWVQAHFYDADAKLYHATTPNDPKALPYDFMWANGVQFSSLVGATRYEPTKYRPILDDFASGLRRYWDKDAPIPGFDAYFSSPDGDDKYYDDNAWLVLGFNEAANVTGEKKYADWARETQNFVLSGYDDKLGGGIYWHQQKKESKNTCINAPAAASAVELYERSHDPKDLATAKDLYNWTCANLQDKDGLFWDNINLKGEVQDHKWTYNTALMIRTNIGLWKATKDPKYLKEARRVSDASIAYFADPVTGAFMDNARFNHLMSEALLQTYQATKDVKYLNAVRRDADFAYRVVRDTQGGGYWNDWKAKDHAPDERKTLIENASVARLYWLLVPYADVDELREQGDNAFKAGNMIKAAEYYRNAAQSTSGAPTTQPEPATAPATAA